MDVFGILPHAPARVFPGGSLGFAKEALYQCPGNILVGWPDQKKKRPSSRISTGRSKMEGVVVGMRDPGRISELNWGWDVELRQDLSSQTLTRALWALFGCRHVAQNSLFTPIQHHIQNCVLKHSQTAHEVHRKGKETFTTQGANIFRREQFWFMFASYVENCNNPGCSQQLFMTKEGTKFEVEYWTRRKKDCACIRKRSLLKSNSHARSSARTSNSYFLVLYKLQRTSVKSRLHGFPLLL